jgi:pimeloyl-ACP methyl ester carboxylesterase
VTGAGTIAYSERGEGAPLVLLPSGAHDHHDFDELRELLPARFRSISLDWPAHGMSPAGAGPASAMRFADIAERLVAELAPDGAVVLGNSVGGFSAARLAIRRPELVRGLVLVDSGGFVGRTLQVRAVCALMGRPWFLKRIYPAFSAIYMRSRTSADRQARARSIATTRGDPGLGAVSELWRSFASPEHDLRALASSIEAPTLLLWGRKDPVIPLRLARKLERTIPHARLVALDAGHVPFTTDPAAVAAELVPFADAAFAGPRAAGDRQSNGRRLGERARQAR